MIFTLFGLSYILMPFQELFFFFLITMDMNYFPSLNAELEPEQSALRLVKVLTRPRKKNWVFFVFFSLNEIKTTKNV